MKNHPRLSEELTINSGTLIVIFLWLSGRFSEDPILSAACLAVYAALDQINTRLWMHWQKCQFAKITDKGG